MRYEVVSNSCSMTRMTVYEGLALNTSRHAFPVHASIHEIDTKTFAGPRRVQGWEWWSVVGVTNKAS